MSREYCSTLGPTLVRYFEQQRASEPGAWTKQLALARAYVELLREEPASAERWRELHASIAALAPERGSALHELELAAAQMVRLASD